MNKEQTSSFESQSYAGTNAQRKYKDTMFRMLFKDKENLLSLYNALNKTTYTDVENLEITTLENAVYMNYKNNISFVFDYELMLYGQTLIKLPTPRFVVFYNGINEQPKQQILRLSDAFQKKQEFPELELCVIVYNINWGNNKELMDACRTLREYAQYVVQVRIYAKELPFNEAVEAAVDYCIRNGILSDFLSKNRAEAIEVSIFEHDEEKHMKSEREWAYNNGLQDGRKEGFAEGEQRLIKLQQLLLNSGKNDELIRAINDKDYREQLYKEYNL